MFLEGRFDRWQSWQSQQNFKKEYVVSLIQAGRPTRWLLAGLFRRKGCVHHAEPRSHYIYDLERIEAAEEWVGRLYLKSTYKQRHSYPLGKTLENDLVVSELLPKRLTIGDFPGFKSVNLTEEHLDIVVRQNIPTWRAALSNVKGVYLITDSETGKLYVGKADGESGIWGRWCTYAATAHGGNVALKKEFGIDALPGGKRHLRFSILEIADIHAMPGEIDTRESQWKQILLSREFGYNLN
ncbi:GIY-YIG nuclease family protein [Pseudomonas plecoglossicida]|uniref:GIY-YIG nuclease family protein n=1 Tax=Pseudomonas plecoglossicida TaxID=70775 RepID=UPI003D1BD2EB